MKEHILWYDGPAANWNEALPLGNGFMGAWKNGKVTGLHTRDGGTVDLVWSNGQLTEHKIY